jgi:hypothetical protein
MPLLDFGIQEIGVIAVVNPPHFHQFMDVMQVGLAVVPHATRVVIDDLFQGADLVTDLEHFVDLLLILDDHEANAGILQHEQHLVGHGVLIERHRHATQTLGRRHHHVQVRAVVADDRQIVAPLETERGQATGQRANPIGNIRPAPGLPDAEILFTHGRRLRANGSVMEQ